MPASRNLERGVARASATGAWKLRTVTACGRSFSLWRTSGAAMPTATAPQAIVRSARELLTAHARYLPSGLGWARMGSRLTMGLFFYPRGGSAQVVRYLVPALERVEWETTLVCGSLGGPGERTNAETFFAGFDVRAADYG